MSANLTWEHRQISTAQIAIDRTKESLYINQRAAQILVGLYTHCNIANESFATQLQVPVSQGSHYYVVLSRSKVS